MVGLGCCWSSVQAMKLTAHSTASHTTTDKCFCVRTGGVRKRERETELERRRGAVCLALTRLDEVKAAWYTSSSC